MFFPVQCVEVKPPKTRSGAWFQAMEGLAQLIIVEAIYALTFTGGFSKTLSSVNGEELFSGLLMAIVGILATTFWPLLFWGSVRNDLSTAWSFKK